MKDGRGIEKTLRDILAARVMVIDGAMGTQLQAHGLTAKDFGGEIYEGCNEHLNLTRPDIVRAVHAAYFHAGADIVETNSFGSTPLVLAEYALGERAYEISRRSAEIAVDAAREFSTSAKPRFVAGSMGPTTRSISVTGKITFDELAESFFVQAGGLVDGGADILLLETAQDTLNIKAALIGIRRALADRSAYRPVVISGTIETSGMMLAGQGVEALYTSVEHALPLAVGLNCALGPEFMADHVRTLSALSRTFVSCYPNGGMPDEEGRYNETPEDFAGKLERYLDGGWVNLVGGCCGTTPDHIRAVAQMVEGKRPRCPASYRRAMVSGIEFLAVTDENRPVLIGEVTNVLGSKKFREHISAGRYEEAAEMGREQVRAGAQMLDVCMQDAMRDEPADMRAFLDVLVRKVRVPLMIDSTDAGVMEVGLRFCQGKSILNSINLEDGEKRFERVCPLIRTYGAAVVVGCIDEDKTQGMAITVERKLAIARRSYTLLTEKYGIAPENIIFDALVFPAGTGDRAYRGSAKTTIDGVAAIKKEFPDCRTALGVSNVSFGLPPAGREVLNSVFLYLATKAGLDFAIVNSRRVMRYADIPEKERALCEQVLYRGSDEDIHAFAELYKVAKPRQDENEMRSRPVEERLRHSILSGSKEHLPVDLDEALKKYPDPLDIINGPLMEGMAEVGRLFNSNELIVAEVLQSAEAMKAAVSHLEPLMKRGGRGGKGKVVIATVKGDVHDIGKNLVEIILSNNGFEVVDLGIKCLPEKIIEACREHRPDIIGLSGLLVKSAQEMVTTAGDLKAAGIDVPILVGGAALSRNFAIRKISPAYSRPVIYAREAMSGLDLANQLMEPARRDELFRQLELEMQTPPAAPTPTTSPAQRADIPARSPDVKLCDDIPVPPDLDRHVIDGGDLPAIFAHINPLMLYKKHLGFRADPQEVMKSGSDRDKEILRAVETLKDEAVSGQMKARAVWKFFPCRSDGNAIHLYAPDGLTILETFEFPRQSHTPYLCVADFVRPVGTSALDYMALFLTTCGDGIRARAEKFKASGEYVKSHAVQALAIESAEAFAEVLHQKLRMMWGIGDPPGITPREMFQCKYRGVRLSFGYPACPNLDDQKKLFALLTPEEIGVNLTDGCMMDPEASVSALVLHHPQARYFSVL